MIATNFRDASRYLHLIRSLGSAGTRYEMSTCTSRRDEILRRFAGSSRTKSLPVSTACSRFGRFPRSMTCICSSTGRGVKRSMLKR